MGWFGRFFGLDDFVLDLLSNALFSVLEYFGVRETSVNDSFFKSFPVDHKWIS
jgi:hypothetical protein